MTIDDQKREEILNHADLQEFLLKREGCDADFVNLDLVGYAHLFKDINIENAVFINCTIPKTLKKQISKQNALIISSGKTVDFDIYPKQLYSPSTLYGGFDIEKDGLSKCFDTLIYQWFTTDKRPKNLTPSQSIFARIHDTALERLIARFIRGHIHETDMLPIAIMGGHAKKRTETAYKETAILARQLARRGHLIITGGGPGLMEAGNLGAFCAPFPDAALDSALSIIAQNDDYHNGIEKWLKSGFDAIAKINADYGSKGKKSNNLSIPTWYYGHEPANVFATHIAKFFYNSLREDGLVSVADGGIVFAEGNAGTVQEIFQDACQNYYRRANEMPTPMIFFNSQKDYWTASKANKKSKSKPLRPLLEQLAGETNPDLEFLSALLFSDNIAEILEFFETFHGEHKDLNSLGNYWRLSKNGHALGDPIQ